MAYGLVTEPFLFIVGRLYGQVQFGRYVFAVGLFEALASFCRLGLRDNLFRLNGQTLPLFQTT